MDVAAEGDELAELDSAVEANPLASVALALLLRGSERRSIGEGLVAESAVYSMLQAGPEFAPLAPALRAAEARLATELADLEAGRPSARERRLAELQAQEARPVDPNPNP